MAEGRPPWRRRRATDGAIGGQASPLGTGTGRQRRAFEPLAEPVEGAEEGEGKDGPTEEAPPLRERR